MKRLNPNILNYGNIPLPYSDADRARFLIYPVPYEATTSYGLGTRFGPKAILDASLHMELYDEELMQDTYTAGIAAIAPFKCNAGSPGLINKTLPQAAANLLDKQKILIALGGEHSISPRIAEAYRKYYNKFSVLHLDAHADLRDSYQGTRYSHGCAARRMLDIAHVVSAGIRSLSSEEAEFIKKTGYNIYFGKKGLRQTDEIVSSLRNDVYISLDVDVLDPSIMPSTGTPEPDGWTWEELISFLKKVIMRKNIIGLDIVEFAPIKGNHAPDFTIAKLLYRVAGYIAISKGWIKKRG